MFATAASSMGHFPHHHAYHPHYQHQQQQQALQHQQQRQTSLLFTPPSTPSTAKGSNDSDTRQLADFAAMMVYLMWHTRKMIKSVDSASSSPTNGSIFKRSISSNSNSSSSSSHHSNGQFLHSSAYYYYNNASPAFKKFCYQVLTATQLKESAVYLSLNYIAILLKSNPSIEGAEGSEYRLFIVALMLSNKFLDDNTFTNKTWSDVSGMKVLDLNVMEAEFLEALDFNLFVRDYDYRIWKNLLEECRHRTQLYQYYQQHNSSQRQQQLILDILQILGLIETANNGKSITYDQQWLDNTSYYCQQQRSPSSSYFSPNQQQQQQQPNIFQNNNAKSDSLFNDEFWDDDSAFRLQLENSRKRYLQFFSQPKNLQASTHHQSTSSLLPPPALYHLMQHQQQHYNGNSNSNSNSYQKSANHYPPTGFYSDRDSYFSQQQQEGGYRHFFYNSHNNNNDNSHCWKDPTLTNLSQSSWDPLAYSLNRCHLQQQEENVSFYSNNAFAATTTTASARPISWANY